MFEAPKSPYLVPFDNAFKIKQADFAPPKDAPDKSECRELLQEITTQIDELQRVLHADNRYSVLFVFQAMDAAGKDSTIRAVLSGINPAGCDVREFTKPTEAEYDHDFLWRTSKSLPGRGMIVVFNRSYYEEVLVARVHPEILGYQRLPRPISLDTIWDERHESILDHEKHLARNGTIIVKFWLNLSKDQQRKRLLKRIDKPQKNWKFEASDIRDRLRWDEYMHAYEETLNATSRPWAPWYAIPADDKPYMRVCVGRIILKTLQSLDIKYPQLDEKETSQLFDMRHMLETDQYDSFG